MDASFYVAVGFLLFFLVAGYYGAFNLIPEMLDKRGKQIAGELDEAEKLRKEAEALLASYKDKATEAEKEAAAIIAAAKEEAEAMAIEATKRTEEFVARRTKQAEDKIALAEEQATNEVRTAAANAAVAAAETVLRNQTKGEAGAELVTRGIEELKAKFH